MTYSEYKNSGDAWIDKIPKSWNTVNLRWLSNLYAGGTPSKNNEDFWKNGSVPWLNSGAVNQIKITTPSTYITQTAYKNSSAKWIPANALVMALAGQGKTKGMVAQLSIDSTCNQSMAAIVPDDISYSNYLFWWLTSNYQNIRNMAGGDMRDGLNLEILGNIKCPIPNSQEQQKISSFLNHETNKIDALIEKQKRLIELLKEKRQAVISHAVTKGLNPDAPMRPSSVEWLGNIPESWTITLLKRYCSVTDGSHHSPSIEETGKPFVSVTDVGDDIIDFKNCKKISVKNYDQLVREGCKPKPGELLLTKDGTIGRAAIVKEQYPNFVILSSLGLLSPSNKFLNTYLYYYLISGINIDQMNSMIHGSALKRMTISKINDLIVTIPSKFEQEKIVKYLDNKTNRFDKLISKAESAITLMQERRAALISAAVTGKIDVRDWQAPEETQNIEEQAA